MMNVCVIGVGLIGGSLGMALRRNRKKGQRQFRVFGLGRSVSKLKLAKRKGAIDHFSTKASDIIPQSDIVVFCTPIQNFASLAKKIKPFLKSGAVVTDAGSVKQPVVKTLNQVLGKNTLVVGAHPMAGSEKVGVGNAKADLFKGATCVLTKDKAKASAINKVRSLWKQVGAKCLLMSAKQHDQIVAKTSHLPHLLAFSLFSLVQKDRALSSVVAGSFNDMTRIAAGDANLWSGIFQENKKAIQEALSEFNLSLKNLTKLNGNKLSHKLSQLSTAKKKQVKRV